MGTHRSLSQEEGLHRQGLFRKASTPSRNYKKSMACASGQGRKEPRLCITLPNAGNGRLENVSGERVNRVSLPID